VVLILAKFEVRTDLMKARRGDVETSETTRQTTQRLSQKTQVFSVDISSQKTNVTKALNDRVYVLLCHRSCRI